MENNKTRCVFVKHYNNNIIYSNKVSEIYNLQCHCWWCNLKYFIPGKS